MYTVYYPFKCFSYLSYIGILILKHYSRANPTSAMKDWLKPKLVCCN